MARRLGSAAVGARGDGVVRGVRREARGRAPRRRLDAVRRGAEEWGGLAVDALQEEGLLLAYATPPLYS